MRDQTKPKSSDSSRNHHMLLMKDINLLQKGSLTENSTYYMLNRIESMQQLVQHLKLLDNGKCEIKNSLSFNINQIFALKSQSAIPKRLLTRCSKISSVPAGNVCHELPFDISPSFPSTASSSFPSTAFATTFRILELHVGLQVRTAGTLELLLLLLQIFGLPYKTGIQLGTKTTFWWTATFLALEIKVQEGE